MGAYRKGDHVKIKVTNEQSFESEWLLVDHSDDEQRLVFGALDSESIVARDMRRGQNSP